MDSEPPSAVCVVSNLFPDDIPIQIEWLAVNLDVFEEGAAHSSCGVIIHNAAFAHVLAVCRHLDVLVAHAVDAAARCTVVFRRFINAQVEKMAFCDAFHPDVAELHVADVVVVAAVDGEQSCSFVVEDVAVVDAYMAEGLAIGIAVIAMRADVHGMCHVGPEDAAAHVNVFRSAPEPPSVVVECDAVVARALIVCLALAPATLH